MKKNFKEERGRKPFVVANQRIRADELRVVTDTGEQLGVLSKQEAQQKADSEGLDLILIVPDAKPPVAKIISINKYNYEIKKLARQNSVEVKEVKFRPAIGENDLKMKLNQVQKFIDKGNKVKVTVQMRGRENSKASDVLEFFNSQISEYLSSFKYDLPLKTNGNRIIGVIIKND